MNERRVVCTVGDLVEDVVVMASQPLIRGADVPATVARHRGGSAANVAVVAARCGAAARFIGAIGSDPTGTWLGARMRDAGVDCPTPVTGTSGTVVIVVEPDGERTMFSDRRSAAELATVDLHWLDDVAALHVPYYAFAGGSLADAARTLLLEARSRGIFTSVDPSTVAMLDERFHLLLRDVQPDVVLCNEDEAAALGVGDDGLRDARLVVVKQGPAPALLRGAVTAEVPAQDVDPIDTTGAGDAFAGGFLTAIVNGATPVDAVGAGHAAAAHVVQGRGADAWVA